MRALVGESGPEMVNITVTSTSNPDDVVRAIRRFVLSARKNRQRQQATAAKARERRQWHKVAGS